MTAKAPSRQTAKDAFALALPALFAALASGALGGAACGTIGASSDLGDAEIAVARAHAAEGDKYAVYETTSADLYLEKAKEEQGHAHYGAAEELAQKSEQLATAAAEKAAQQRNGTAAPSMPRATITHQANEAPRAPEMIGTPTVGTPSNPPPAPALIAPPASAPASVPAPVPAPAELPPAPLLVPGSKP